MDLDENPQRGVLLMKLQIIERVGIEVEYSKDMSLDELSKIFLEVMPLVEDLTEREDYANKIATIRLVNPKVATKYELHKYSKDSSLEELKRVHASVIREIGEQPVLTEEQVNLLNVLLTVAIASEYS